MSEDPARRRRSRGANGDGGGRQRADGVWEWRIALPGTNRRISAFASTKAEARRKCREKVKLAGLGLDTVASRQTLGVFLSRWLDDYVEPQLAPKTFASYRDTVNKHITPTLGRVELGKLTPQQVQRFLHDKGREKKHSPQDIQALLRMKEQEGELSANQLDAFRRELEQQPKLSPSTVAYIRSVLRIALNRALKWNLIERNVAALTDAPRKTRTERRPLTIEQAQTFLRAVEGDRLEALYLLTAALGLRIGEGLGLRWQDIDLDTNTLRVRQVVQRVDGRLIIKQPKTDKSRRTLSLPAVVVDALRQHRDRQAFAAKNPGWQDQGFVFTTRNGGPLNPANVLRRFKQHLAALGLPDQRFHDLRHYAATFMLGKGVPMRVIQDILGHSQMATTSDLYAHVMPAAHREVASLFDEAMQGS